MCKELLCLVTCVFLFVTTGAARAEQIWGEAETASSITAPLRVVEDATASGGKYITVAAGNNSSGNPPSTGVARYRIRVKEGGVYSMYLRVLCSPDVDAESSDSCWVRIQGATLNITVAANGWVSDNNIDYQVADPEEWFWKQVGHYAAYPGNDFVEFTMAPGAYTVEIAYREDGLWIDGFMLTNDPDFDADALPDVIPFVQGNVSSNPQPGNGESDVASDAVLSWTPGEFAHTHNVYIGTEFHDVNEATVANPLGATLIQGLDVSRYVPSGGLGLGQTYYWRVDEVNAPPTASTVFKGPTWSFTVEPYSYPITPAAATASSLMNDSDKMGPANTISGLGLDPNTDQHSIEITTMWVSSKAGPQPTWIQYDFDRALKLDQMWVWNSNQALEEMLGYGVKQAKVEVSTDGTTWTEVPNVPEFAQATGQSDYVHNTTVDLGGAVAQHVRLTCLSTWGGGSIYSLSEVRFFQVPTRARAPQPESGAANVAVDTLLNWRPGRQAARHEVYLGTDPNALALAQTVTDHQVALDALGSQYGQTYYWRVDEVNDTATPQSWEGDVWTFSTPVFKVVDDFESYNDQCGRIFFSWSDGYGHSGSLDCGVAPASGNGTGSTVGKADAPYAERDNVHSGAQAMPFSYDNTSGSGVSEAVLTFSPAQDWTAGGLKTLVLFFKGDPANGAGQVYVKINGTKVSYNGNPAALSTGLWNQWNVDLSGLSVQAVSSLTLGVSGTGKGDLYVDDIRLYGQAPAVAVPTDPGTGALAAYYAFEGDAQDAAGKGYNGTLMNEPTFGDSKAGLGKALALDGVNDYVDLPIGSLISTLTSATVSAWINFDTASTGSWVRLFDFGTSSTAGYMFLSPRQGTTNPPRFAITTGTNTGESGINAPGVLSAGWHHVAVVIDGVAMTLQLVLDGEVVASGATAVVPRDLGVTTQNWLGHSQWPDDGYYQGLIDEFRIYNRVLTVGEVRYLAGDR